MKSALIFILLSCSSCLCTKCRDCEASHEAVVLETRTTGRKERTVEIGKMRHDDTTRDLTYKGRKTPESLHLKHRGGPVATGLQGDYLLRPDTR